MVDCKIGTENIQGKPEAVIVPESKRFFFLNHIDVSMSEGYISQLKDLPMAQAGNF